MTVYKPGEDTYLLLNYLEKQDLEDKKFLDMGTGNGEIALKAAEKGAKVTAADINPEAIKYAREKAKEKGLDIEFIESDLFENIEDKYDIIAFNPPYLPGKKGLGDEKIWRGGKKGIKTTEQFLSRINPYLRPSGYALIIGSSQADLKNLKDNFNLSVVDKEKIWFEELQILKYAEIG